MFDQGNHASEYHGQSNPPRGAAAPPHPPFSQGPPGHLAQFPQGLPVPPPSEIQHGAPPHPSIQQAPPGPLPFPYQHVLPAPPAQQPLHLPPQGPISMGQPYSFIRSGPLFPSSMPGNNANHVAQGLQPMPPPLRVFPPQPLPPPPRQSMYRIPPPPPHGVQHMPVPPPPAPPSFVSITPALFMPPGNTSAQDTHPPSLPPPPPPPPPPPSSPPPLPPSPPPASPAPDISVAISKTPSDDNRICIDIVDVSVDPVLSTYNMPPGGSSHVEVDDIKEKVSLGVQEAWGGSPSPPPRPVEEEVVRRIEVLCKSIAKVGPDFENFARAKEVGNPHFSFLFGGEPGSSAAAAREYFQWVKKKCCLEPNLSKDSKDIVLPEPPITEASPKALIFENKEQGISPTVSDMDVEDDNNSSFMEDVSPARSLPGAAELDLDGRVQHCVRQLHDVSSIVSVSPTTGACKVMEAGVGNVMESPNVFVKDRSPFRLIQGYASDDSGEDKREYAGNIHNITASTSSIEGILDSHKDRKSEYCLNFSTKAAKNTDTGTELQGYSVKSSTIQNEASPYGSPSPRRRTSPIVIRPKLDAICNGNDPGADEQDDQGLDCRVGSEALRNHYSVEGGRMDVNSQLKRHHPEEAQRPALPNLDEFGRLVREGFSDSDSDGMQYSKKHGKKGKTRSGSRSPQESRRRWRSRSPRKRYKRSRSSSSSPRRSKSPPTFRQTNMHAKREQPSECFNFIRGRCFRGASCRFLHRDAGQRRDRKQQYRGFHQDSVDYDLREATQAHETWDEGRPKKSKDILHNQRFTVGSEKEYASRTQDNSREGSFKDQISQEIVSQTEKEQQVEMLKDSPSIINSKKEEITLVLLDSSQPLPADSLVQSVPAHKLESSSNGNDLGESGSGLQTFQAGHCSSISDPPNVQYLVPAVQPSSDQASTPQENQGGSPVRQLSARYGPMAQSSDQLVHSTEVSVSHSLAPVVNSHPSHQVVHEHLPLFPSDNVTAPFAAEHLRENSLPPSSSYHPQPSPPVMLQSQQPTMGSDYHSQNVHPPSQNLPSFPSLSQPPPVSLLTGISGRPSFPTEYPRPQFEQNPSPAGNFAQDIMRSYHPVELSLSHQHLSQMDGFNRTLPVGNQQNPLFSREEWFLHHPGPEGPRIMSGTLQSGSHMHHQSSLCENARISLSAGGPSSFSHGNIVQPSLPFPGAVVQHEFQSLMGDRPPPRFLQREEFSSIRGLPYLQQQTSYGPQHPPSNPSGHGTADPSFQGFPSSFAESNLPHHVPDIGLPKFSITTRYNPFASTFEHTPSSLNISSGISGQANVLEYNMKYDLSHSSGHGLGGGPGSRMATLSSDLGPSQGHLLPRAGDYSYGTSAELPSVQKQFGAEPASGLPYDPLFDSIEPSTSLIKKVDVRQKQNLRAGDVGNMSKLSSLPRPVDIENNSKEKGVALAESEADELGEVATDVEVGVVENASPQPDANDWSPDIPDNVGNLAAGSIETDQVRSSGKSKKSKESRSSKVFKNAIASFVKEVLKPSWRQGNMSKEAFKTIVKKTVDKVYNSAHHIPKSQAKINQYVESSERKITKLVMGYVNKYVKM